MLTRLLVVANILVFVWTSMNHITDSDQLLIKYGAMYGPAVASGEWWRIFTAGFLHGGLLHVSFNMFALWQVGSAVEDLFGTPRMALIYLLSLIGSGIAIYEFAYNDVTIGASGAIFGIFGALAAAGMRLGPRGRDLVRGMLGIVLIKLIIGFMVPNISMSGHVGGLVVGFIVGFLLFEPPVPSAPIYVNAEHGDNIIEAELLPPEHPPGTPPR